MLHSMTGYGRAERTIGDKTFLIELKSLNGKQYDIRLNIPALLKPYEFDIRNDISDALTRGSVECVITIKQNGAPKTLSINTDVAKYFYTTLETLATELNASKDNILSAILKLPDVVVNSTEVLSENDFNAFRDVLKEALRLLNLHRENEGKVLEKDLLERINNIEKLQPLIAEIEPNRRVKIKENFVKLLSDYVGKENYDEHRLEQELIYYIEKIDISEEQVRLKNHCNYFKEILKEKGVSKGKKLAFILQEIGREINTTGSKAYDIDIQRYVVEMKDELEKAKEQILNVL
ncbi:YicC family protein [Arachidicoccus ginsenosidimutans]|uniref:YicC/YloC family endoribonuclease n=1 Tax=Arachidicoccus sp. BS20 TaxID=1850526 RepID=UPI0007F0693F|nr:YicC/YloC family endoribonuclease [Arachidicoccus sp. BS20]ANI88219.1 YicC family protein [Arachidicoccus sp. BS20]